MQRLPALLIGLTAAAITTAAHAAPRLDYRAAPGCPADTEFLAAVEARGGNVDLAGGSANGIDVVIERTSDGYRGTVRVKDTEQSSEAREVSSAACGEVADGLAIVTALASRTGSLPDATTVTTPNAVAPAPASPPATAPLKTPVAKPAPATRLHTVGQFGDETLTVSSGEVRVRNDTSVTLTGGALFGIAPGTVLPRFDLTLARTNFITTPDGGGHIVGGIIRVRWTVLTPTEYRKDDWSAQLFVLKASIGGCSQLFYDLEGLVVLACGEVGAGLAQVTTKDPTGHTTQDERQGLGSAAVELDVRYNLGHSFHLGLMAGGEAWLGQVKATQSSGSEIFHTNLLGGYALAGFGLHFW